jgi:hypothetical protein
LKLKHGIAIFDTFKSRENRFTGEARRQRGIIAHLATEQSPELRTRTSIAHLIAEKQGILWQNMYSGIFRDLDEVLIPSGVVKEGGRLPLRRGPKALQMEGVPFYELSESGLIVASALEELGRSRMRILESTIKSVTIYDPNDEYVREGILLLIRFIPAFMGKIINLYVRAYCSGSLSGITPIDIKKLRMVLATQIEIEKEIIGSSSRLRDEEWETLQKFVDRIA